MNTVIKAVSIAVAIMGAPTYASDAVGPGESDSRWVVGGAVVSVNNVYRGESNDAVLLPIFRYNGEKFFVKHGTANYSFFQNNGLSMGASLRLDGNYLIDDEEYRDNPYLKGLKERDGTVEGGLYILHTTDLGRLKVAAYSDIAGKHHGESAEVSYTMDLKFGDIFINPVLGAEWIGEDKLNHMYGVNAGEATATRAAYQTGSAVNFFAGVRARYEFTENWDMQLSTGVKRLDSSISDSSIVNADYDYHASVAVSYNF